MSTNHTPNYNLCQWEATDQVLRSDFNQDNDKIDAALAGKIGKPELICIMEQTDTFMNNALFNLSSINWGDWAFVFLVSEAKFTQHGSSSTYALSFINPNPRYRYSLSGGSNPLRFVLFYTGYDANRNIFAISDSGASFFDGTYNVIDKIQLSHNNAGIPDGTPKLHIYGMK